jgi:hypothetical protein
VQPESTTTDSIPSVEVPVFPTDAQPEVLKTFPTPERKTEVKCPGSVSKRTPLPHCIVSIPAVPSPEQLPSTLIIGKARVEVVVPPQLVPTTWRVPTGFTQHDTSRGSHTPVHITVIPSFKRLPATSAKEKPREEVHAPPQLVHLTRELPGDSPKYDSTQGTPAVPYGFPKLAVPCPKQSLPTPVVRVTREVSNTPPGLVSDRQEPAVSSSEPEVDKGSLTLSSPSKADLTLLIPSGTAPVITLETRDVRNPLPLIKTDSMLPVLAETNLLASLSHGEAGYDAIPKTSALESPTNSREHTLSSRTIPKQPIDALGIQPREPLLSKSMETRSLALLSVGFPLHTQTSPSVGPQTEKAKRLSPGSIINKTNEPNLLQDSPKSRVALTLLNTVPACSSQALSTVRSRKIVP